MLILDMPSKPINIPGSTAAILAKQKGYFNKTRNNHRPPYIKAYANSVRLLGKNKANSKFPDVLNWISSQKMQGLNSRIHLKSRKNRRR